MVLISSLQLTVILTEMFLTSLAYPVFECLQISEEVAEAGLESPAAPHPEEPPQHGPEKPTVAVQEHVISMDGLQQHVIQPSQVTVTCRHNVSTSPLKCPVTCFYGCVRTGLDIYWMTFSTTVTATFTKLLCRLS